MTRSAHKPFAILTCANGHKMYRFTEYTARHTRATCPICRAEIVEMKKVAGWQFLTDNFKEHREAIRDYLKKYHNGRRYVSAIILFREIEDEPAPALADWHPCNIKQIIAATLAEDGYIKTGKNGNTWLNPAVTGAIA